MKDMIESLGVPHTEVDLILAGDKSVDFNYRVKDGDRILERLALQGDDKIHRGALTP